MALLSVIELSSGRSLHPKEFADDSSDPVLASIDMLFPLRSGDSRQGRQESAT